MVEYRGCQSPLREVGHDVADSKCAPLGYLQAFCEDLKAIDAAAMALPSSMYKCLSCFIVFARDGSLCYISAEVEYLDERLNSLHCLLVLELLVCRRSRVN